MKTKLLLLLAMSIGLVSSAWAEDVEISNADELVEFAERVNGGETSLNAVLTDDIDLEGVAWTPIGNASNKYAGTFDGKGYAITNFSYTATSFDAAGSYSGLFGCVKNANIKDFFIDGTLTVDGGTKDKTYTGTIGAAEASSVISGIHSALNINVSNFKAHTGGILGSTVTSGNPVLVENCEYSGTLTHSGAGDCQAGILGYTYNGGVFNCIFSGTIKGENNKYGGILGYGKVPGFKGIQNCLSIGKIVANEDCTTAAAIIANWNGAATENVKNNYYCLAEGSTTNRAIGNKASSCEDPVAVTAEQLASGEVTYRLNGNQSADVAFYQTIPTDKLPTLNENRAIVYANGRAHCNGDAIEGEISYSNENLGIVWDDHDYVDGFCDYCGILDENYITANGEGFYELGTPAQFVWFAAYANQINASANAVLTDDIDLNGVTWTPIGNESTKYTGTFDGQGYEINNFSLTSDGTHVGLFGYINTGAVIKNFTIDGTITSTGQRQGVIGSATGNVTISGIHSKVNLTCTQTRHGGVLGAQSGDGTVNIDRCIYSGTFTTDNISGNFAGIIGLSQNSTNAYVNITNCLFDGVINIGTGDNAGGIIGYTRSCHLTIKNCLSIGTIKATNPGQFVGQINTTSNMSFAGDNFYVNGDKVQGTGSGAPIKDSTTPEKVTTAQLTSGEVAYKLGEDWGQLLDADPYPTPSYDVKVNYVGEAGYATMYDETSGYELNGDVEAYVAVPNKNYPNLILTKIDNVPASTPVILKGTYYNKVEADLKPIDIANVLKGAATDVEAEGKYILAKPAEKEVGFYLAETGTIKAGKAYIELDGNASVKALFFAEDGETAINNVNVNDNVNNAAIYNIAGQRINKLQKGINIVNGKKILF